MQEYWAQSILASQPGTDALEYARQWPGQTPVATHSTLDYVRSMQPAAQAVNTRAPLAVPALPSAGPDSNPAPRWAPAPTAQPPNPVVLRSPNPTIGPDGNPILQRWAPAPRPWGPTPPPTTSQSPWEYDPGS